MMTREQARRLPVVGADQTREVAGFPGQRLVPDAASALERLLAAARADGVDLRPVSTWRARPWATRADYEADMVRRYGSVAKGQRWVAWDSLHHRGIAADLVGAGLSVSSANADAMRGSVGDRWLAANAERFGFGRYDPEPWHVEYRPLGFAGLLNRIGVKVALTALGALALARLYVVTRPV